MNSDPETIRTSLRLHKPLYDKLAEAADAHGLTMHAEVISRLERFDRLSSDCDLLMQRVSYLQEHEAQRIADRDKFYEIAQRNAETVSLLANLLRLKLGATDDEIRETMTRGKNPE